MNKLVAKSIQAFIIGSSWPIFILYFMPVSTYGELANFDYKSYTFVAPVFLGLLNVIGFLIAKRYDLGKTQRFFTTGLIGALFIGTYITLFQVYNYDTQSQWLNKYRGLLIIYFLVFGVIANTLERVIETV